MQSFASREQPLLYEQIFNTAWKGKELDVSHTLKIGLGRQKQYDIY
jgi:hypothetical protein